MTRCEAFYQKCKQLIEAEDFDALEDFCRKDAKSTIWRIREYIAFCEKHSLPIGNVSEGALRPLIAEADMGVQEKIVSIVKEKLAQGGVVVGGEVKHIIMEAKGIKPTPSWMKKSDTALTEPVLVKSREDVAQLMEAEIYPAMSVICPNCGVTIDFKHDGEKPFGITARPAVPPT